MNMILIFGMKELMGLEVELLVSKNNIVKIQEGWTNFFLVVCPREVPKNYLAWK